MASSQALLIIIILILYLFVTPVICLYISWVVQLIGGTIQSAVNDEKTKIIIEKSTKIVSFLFSLAGFIIISAILVFYLYEQI